MSTLMHWYVTCITSDTHYMIVQFKFKTKTERPLRQVWEKTMVTMTFVESSAFQKVDCYEIVLFSVR